MLALALLCSGFAALAVEVLWQRLLVHALGGSTQALTAVLVAYMGGLALGAAIASRRGDRLSVRAALRAYIVLELLIGAAAVGVSFVLGSLPPGLGGFLVEAGPAARLLGRTALATLLLLLPTTAMGATLPLVVRAWVGARPGELLRGTGWLYAANTLGAVGGALAAPLLLIPALGVSGAATVAPMGSLLAAVIAFGALRRAPAEDEGAAAPDDDDGDDEALPATGERPDIDGWVTRAVMVGAFASGATSLGYQVLWTRLVTSLGGATVLAFGVVLAVVLSGIALGAWLVGASKQIAARADIACALALIVGAVLSVFTLTFVELGHFMLTTARSAGTLDTSVALRAVVLTAIGVVLPPTLMLGAVLPLAVRASAAEGQAAGPVGRVYVANTVGALVGAGLTGPVLLTVFGVNGAARALSFVAGFAALALVGVLALRGAERGGALVGLAAIGMIAIVAAPLPPPILAATRAHDGKRSEHARTLLYYADGPEASVVVTAVGEHRSFFVGGRTEASTWWADVRSDQILGHLPALLMDRPVARSLVVGLGAGITAGALSTWGKVTVAELNRVVPGATAFFRDINHDVVNTASVIIEDGRVIMARPGPGWDVITTDPIHPSVAGCASLYTREHFAHERNRLTEGGVVSQWLPIYGLGPDEVRGVTASFVDVFPDAEAWLFREQVILIGGGPPGRTQTTSAALLAKRWNDVVAADLGATRVASATELAASRIAGPDELKAYIEGARRHTDDDPWIELTLAAYLYDSPLAENVETFLALRPAHQREDPVVAGYDAVQRAYVHMWRGEIDRGVALLERTRHDDDSSPLLEHALLLRELRARLALKRIIAGQPGPHRQLALNVINDAVATPTSLITARNALVRLGDRSGVLAANAKLRERFPERPEGFLFGSQAALDAGELDQAEAWLNRVTQMATYPDYAGLAVANLGRVALARGDKDRARALLEQSDRVRPGEPWVLELLQTLR